MWGRGIGGTRGRYLLGVLAAAVAAATVATAAARRQPGPPPPDWGPLAGLVVVVDAGHGGVDQGTSVAGVDEAGINLAIAKATRTLLRRAGAAVVLTRENGDDLAPSSETLSRRKKIDLETRARQVNQLRPDVFVSIHVNYYPDSGPHGAQAFYDQRNGFAGQRLATDMQASLQAVLGSQRTVLPINNFLLGHVGVPGVLVEVGFLSNPSERKKLQDAAYQQKVAWAILLGVARYLAGAPH